MTHWTLHDLFWKSETLQLKMQLKGRSEKTRGLGSSPSKRNTACVASVSVGFRGKELPIPRLSYFGSCPNFAREKYRTLVFLCSPAPRKRLLRRLALPVMRYMMYSGNPGNPPRSEDLPVPACPPTRLLACLPACLLFLLHAISRITNLMC